MLARLRDRQEILFFGALTRADRALGIAWYAVLLLRGILPAVFAVAMGALVGAVDDGHDLTGPLVLVGITFVLMQVLVPIHQALSYDLGDRTAAWLYDRLTDACLDPPGMGHLEDPALTSDLVTAREFDAGMTGPPLSIDLEFISGSLVQMVGGLASVALLLGFHVWAPIVLGGAWILTHRLLRESAVWHDRNTDEVRAAQRDADYTYRISVDPPAAKELRLFGLTPWVMDRFRARRRHLHDLQYEATRLRERSVLSSFLIVGAANLVVVWALCDAAIDGRLDLDGFVVYAQATIGASMIAFGGLSWALDGAAAPVAAVRRLRAAMAPAGALREGTANAAGTPAVELRFREVGFAYPTVPDRPILDGFDLSVPAGTSLAIVGVNGAGKTTMAKLLCRLYDPTSGVIEVDGTDLRDYDVAGWRTRVTAVFQDFIRFELTLRENVDPTGRASDDQIRAALTAAGAAHLADLDTPLSKGYAGGTDLSGGQWQRVALARALCAVESGAGLVLLDEPTAQLDVRGEAEIFERLLAATRSCTTILVSHRFSTVRKADRICVLEHGRVVEVGTHDELMATGGRYRTMFDLQAERFAAGLGAEGEPEPEEVSLDAVG